MSNVPPTLPPAFPRARSLFLPTYLPTYQPTTCHLALCPRSHACDRVALPSLAWLSRSGGRLDAVAVARGAGTGWIGRWGRDDGRKTRARSAVFSRVVGKQGEGKRGKGSDDKFWVKNECVRVASILLPPLPSAIRSPPEHVELSVPPTVGSGWLMNLIFLLIVCAYDDSLLCQFSMGHAPSQGPWARHAPVVGGSARLRRLGRPFWASM